MIREFKIQNDRLTSVKYPKGVTGNVNTYICQFDISCDVPDLLWFCVFIQGKEVYIRDIVDNTCVIPEEVLASAEPIYIGSYGTNGSDDIKRVSTNLVFFDMRQGAYTEGTQPKVPTPDVWETLVARMTPIIGENGNWFTYDISVGDYVDTGKSSEGRGNGGTGSSITVDKEMSDISENPVQNKTVKEYVDNTRMVVEANIAGVNQTATEANQKAKEALDALPDYAKTTEVQNEISNHNTSDDSHNDIRIAVTELSKRLNAVADSEDIELDQLSEIVAYIKSNKNLIDSITTSKVNVVDIIDNLTTNVTNKPLSAKQGLELKKLIDSLNEYVANAYKSLQNGNSVAWNTAKEANTKAENAQTTADEAKTTANTAQSKADYAHTLASGAGTLASQAKTTAEEALTKGNGLEKSKQDKLSDEQINNINDIPGIKKDYAKTEDVNADISTHNTSDESHSDIRLLIQGLTDRLNVIANSDDLSLDQLSEIVAYIKNNKDLIDGITTSKVSISDIVDNLTTNAVDKPLSAKQGVELKKLIDVIVVPTLLSQLGQDATHRLVTDAEKQTWDAKSNFGGKFSDLTNKPTTLEGYGITDGATKTDLNNLSEEVDEKQPKGNYALKGELPTKTSQLTNDSGFLTEHQDLSDYAKESAVEEKLSTHNASDKSHNDIRILVQGLTDRLNALADSDDTTLDQLSEIVVYIKNNKTLIDSITTSKVSVTDIVDNLTSNVSNKPLSAKQGVALKALIDAIVVPTKTSQLTNDSGYLKAIPSEYITESELNAKGYLTEHQSLSGYAKTADHYTKTESDGKYQPKGNYLTSHQDISGKADKSSAETWTFTLSDGSTTTKKVVLA